MRSGGRREREGEGGSGRMLRNAQVGNGASAAVVFWAVMGLSLPVSSGAQTVVGTVTDAESRAPIEAALVTLGDSTGARRAGTLTDAQGTFRLRAPAPGEYSLQVERLGYETSPSRPVRVGPGEGVRVSFELASRAIELEGIEVQGERRCMVRPEEGLLLAEVWDEASKALRNQEWNERERRIRFQLREYVREFDPRSRMVLSERREPERWTSGEPFRSIGTEALLTGGFIREADEGEDTYEYFAPDASVLLSDEFLDSHCFRLVEGPESEDLVGIRFEPVGDRTNDIEGTLWLSREGARPRHLEYTYTWSPWWGARGVAGGRVEFDDLPGGNWIVRRWWIRMPQMRWDPASMRDGRSGYEVASILEQGGSISAVQQSRRSPLAEASTGTVTGVVRDSTGSGHLADVEVFLSGTSHAARTDSSGQFRIPEVPVGSYDVTFRHPSLDSLGMHPPAREALVLEDETTEVTLRLPRREELLGVLCPAPVDEGGWLALVGTVRSTRTRDPVPGAVVELEWKEFELDASGRRYVADVQTRRFVADELGRYRACGVPPGVMLEARASSGGSVGRARSPRSLPSRSIVELDLAVEVETRAEAQPDLGAEREGAAEPEVAEPAPARPDPRGDDAEPTPPADELESLMAAGTIVGRLFDGESGDPVAAGDVVLLDSDGRAVRHASSREDGRFLIRAPEPGRYRLRVERIGYQTTTSSVLDLTGEEGLSVQYAMTAQAIAIDPITVSVRPEAVVHPRLDFHGYYDRKDYYGRRTGFGHFLDGEDLRSNASNLLHMLQELPGIRITGAGGPGGTEVIAVGRRGCRVNFFLDGHLVRREGRAPNSPEVIHQYVSPSEIIAIEVYPGRMMPAKFMLVGEGAECTAVAIWTGAPQGEDR